MGPNFMCKYLQHYSFLNILAKLIEYFVCIDHLWSIDALKVDIFSKIENDLDINVWKNPWIL